MLSLVDRTGVQYTQEQQISDSKNRDCPTALSWPFATTSFTMHTSHGPTAPSDQAEFRDKRP